MVLAATCGGDGATDGGTGPGTLVIIPVNLSITPTLITARQGITVPATLTFTRTGTSTAPLTLSAAGLSDGTTVTFNPATISTASGTIQLSISATASAVIKTDTLLVTARGTESGGKLETGTVGVNLLVSGPFMTVTRAGTGSGTVTSTPAGINCGSTCTGTFISGTTVTLTAVPATGSTFVGWSGGCSGTSTTCSVTSAAGLAVVVASFNSNTPNFSIAVDPTAVTVPQGASGTATVTLARNNFVSVVNFAVSGAPPGLTVTPNPATISGTTSTLNIGTSLSLAAGNYPITVTATGNGLQRSTTLAVRVTASAGGSNNVSMSFASCDPSLVPVWFGAQSGTGAWTRVTPAANSIFTFTPGATGGFAFVTPDGNGFRTQVILGTASEITAIATGSGPCFLDAQLGTKRVSGTATHFGSPAFASVNIGGAQAIVPATTPSYSLPNVPAGMRDLIGAQEFSNGGSDTVVQKMIIRRNTQYADGATAPDLDFSGVESFIPVNHPIKLTNLNGDQSHATLSFVTANGQSAEFFSSTGRFFTALSSDAVPLFGIPDSLLKAGDFHLSSVYAAASDGKSARFAESMYHSLPDQTFTFGPLLPTPTISTIATSPSLRPRAQLPSQSAYNAGVNVEYDQGANAIEVTATAGYFGGIPPTWTVDVPDFAGASYDASWGLRSGATLSWLVVAAGGNVLPFFGATIVDGAQIIAGLTSNSSASLTAARRRK
jgi:hypothetical protein